MQGGTAARARGLNLEMKHMAEVQAIASPRAIVSKYPVVLVLASSAPHPLLPSIGVENNSQSRVLETQPGNIRTQKTNSHLAKQWSLAFHPRINFHNCERSVRSNKFRRASKQQLIQIPTNAGRDHQREAEDYVQKPTVVCEMQPVPRRR